MIGRNTSASSHASVAAADRRCMMITNATTATQAAIAAVRIGTNTHEHNAGYVGRRALRRKTRSQARARTGQAVFQRACQLGRRWRLRAAIAPATALLAFFAFLAFFGLVVFRGDWLGLGLGGLGLGLGCG